jgi:hypothetical protein
VEELEREGDWIVTYEEVAPGVFISRKWRSSYGWKSGEHLIFLGQQDEEDTER